MSDWTAGVPRLLLYSCDRCGRYRYVPRLRCDACAAPEATPVPAAGHGLCVAFSELVVTADRGEPVRLALIEVAEGPIVMTRADADVCVGDRVEIRFDDSTGALLPVATTSAATPAAAATARTATPVRYG